MTKQDCIWVVYKGEYDISVLCACAKRKDAQAVADKYNKDPDTWLTAYVMRLPLAGPEVEKVRSYQLTVTLWDDGEVTDDNENHRDEWPFDMLYPTEYAVEWRWVRAPIHENQGGRLDVYGFDLDQVREVKRERQEFFSDPQNAKSKSRKGHVK